MGVKNNTAKDVIVIWCRDVAFVPADHDAAVFGANLLKMANTNMIASIKRKKAGNKRRVIIGIKHDDITIADFKIRRAVANNGKLDVLRYRIGAEIGAGID